MKLLISIIIPVYNAESFLVTCLESILQQTYHMLDIIIINDGSTDKSGDIASQYVKKDSRIRLYHQSNLGPSAARNLGIQKAKGEYIQFVDADDFIKQDAVAKLVHFCQSNIDLIIFGYHRNKQKGAIPISNGNYSKSEFFRYIGLLYNQTILASPCNKLYKHSIISKHRIRFQEEKAYGEDLLFNLEYLKHCKRVYMYNATLYIYRKHDKSLTNSYIPNLFRQQQYLQQKVEQFLQAENNLTETNSHYLKITNASHTIYAATNLCTQRYDKSTLDTLDNMLKDPKTKSLIPYFSDGIQARIFRYFVRYEATKLAYIFFKLKEYTKGVIGWRR